MVKDKRILIRGNIKDTLSIIERLQAKYGKDAKVGDVVTEEYGREVAIVE